MKPNFTNLDLLRTLAVLSVVVQHLWHQCVNFGLCAYDPAINRFLGNLSFTGVMFFFVHTSLVLMLSMRRAPSTHRGTSFLIRRAFRIYPLCWATIFLALATGLTDKSGGNLHALGFCGVAVNLLLVQNMIRRFPSVVGPLWSLPWEVQMYLVLPVFFAVLRRFDRLFVVFLLWLVAALLAVAATQPAMPRMFHAAIFPPMFISGMVAYRLLERREVGSVRHAFPAWSWPFFILALFAAQSLLKGDPPFETPIGSLVNACICLTLGMAIPAFGELKAKWIVITTHQIAKYSYGIYLLHVPALIFVMRYLHGLSLGAKIFTFLFLTLLLSFVSFHFIEDPLIALGKRLTHYGKDEGHPGTAGTCLVTATSVSLSISQSEELTESSVFLQSQVLPSVRGERA